MKKGEKLKDKKEIRGLSPVIATVLLIAIVVVIALIVFFWIRGFTSEAVTKLKGENIQLACGKVSFEASYTTATGLYIQNPGTIPIFDMNVKIVGDGSHTTVDLRDVNAQWPDVGLNQGGVFTDENFASTVGTASEIVLTPILLGESKSGRKTYVCDENQYGQKITVSN